MPINQDILEGIKYAVARGESLESAKITFKNSGYSEQEITEAVNSFQGQPEEQEESNSFVNTTEVSKPRPVQKISNYESEKSESIFQKKWFVVSLAILLVILLGALISLFLFRDEILSFINNLFV